LDIRVYVGAHKTASKHLINTLINNNAELIEEGLIFLDRPGWAMRQITRAFKSINNGADKADVTNEMLHTLTNGSDTKRLLSVYPDLIGGILRPFGNELLYPLAKKPIEKLRNVFEHHELRLYMSVRSPATFLPSCYAGNALNASLIPYADYIKDVNLPNLKWSSLIHRIHDEQNSVPLTVWRYEDYPYIWRDVAQAFAGLSNGQDLLGDTKRINHSLTLSGAQLLNEYIKKYGIENGKNFDSIKKIYLERFPSSPNEIIGPNWSPETVNALTNNYDDDWYYIERIDDVIVIQARQNMVNE
jgi:hypothetical protein